MSEPHHYAALALAAAHAHTHPSASSCCAAALDDAVRVGSGVRALIWLAYAEHQLPKRHLLLYSHPKVLARDLYHTVFTPVSDSSPYTSHQNDLAYNGLKPSIKRFSSLAPIIGRRSANDSMLQKSAHDVLADDSDKADRVDDLLLLSALKLEQGDFSSALANAKIAQRFSQGSSRLYQRASNALSLILIRQNQHVQQGSPDVGCQSDDFNCSAHWHWCELIQSVRSGYGRKSLKHARVLCSLSSSSQSNSDILLDAHEAQVLCRQSYNESFRLCDNELLQNAAGNHRCARYVRAQLVLANSLLHSRTLCFALRVCLGAVSIASALGLTSLHIEACVCLADCLGRSPDIAISILQPLLHRLQSCDPSIYARALRVWGEAHCHHTKHQNYDMCERSIAKAVAIYSRLGDVQALSKCTYIMARLWNTKMEHASCERDTQQARRMRNIWSKRFHRTMRIINRRRI